MPAIPSGGPDLLLNAPCGLVELGPGHTIRYANPYFQALTQRTAEALAGQALESVLTVASRVLLQTRLAQELALGGRLEEVAVDVLAADGARIPVMLNATQQPADGDGPGRIHLAIWRAMGRRAYEAEVPKARQAAEEAAQAKADFLANISHEIRTPLNGLIGAAHLLKGGADARQQELVQIIAESGHTLERLISDMLEVARVQAGALRLEIRPFDPMAELQGVIDRATLRARARGLTLRVQQDEDLPDRLLGDAVRLRQIVEHLLSNAVKFTDAGEVRLALGRHEDHLTIEVADTGIGFDMAEFAALSERFSQADTGLTRKHDGAGMGLFLCRSLVELMGGTFSATSQRGVGSRFAVDLPLPACVAPAPAPPPSGSDNLLEAPLRVLYVEDNPTNQRVVQLMLAELDLDLQLADNGLLGVQAWAAGTFDVVLMDLQMPVMDGLTAIREIRGIEGSRGGRARTPIIVVSANAMEHHQREALEAGADLHVAKPISPAALLDGLQQAIVGQTIPAE